MDYLSISDARFPADCRPVSYRTSPPERRAPSPARNPDTLYGNYSFPVPSNLIHLGPLGTSSLGLPAGCSSPSVGTPGKAMFPLRSTGGVGLQTRLATGQHTICPVESDLSAPTSTAAFSSWSVGQRTENIRPPANLSSPCRAYSASGDDSVPMVNNPVVMSFGMVSSGSEGTRAGHPKGSYTGMDANRVENAGDNSEENTPPSTSTGEETSTTATNKGGTKDINGRFFKTRMCLFHQRGACVKGENCSYAHADVEKRPIPDLMKTRLCQDWLNGSCTSPGCKFAHGRRELRYTQDFYKTKICHFWQQGGCTKGAMCRHAHGAHELRPLPDGANIPQAARGSMSSAFGTLSAFPQSMLAPGRPAIPPGGPGSAAAAAATSKNSHPAGALSFAANAAAAAVLPAALNGATGLAEELLSAAAAAAAAAATQPPLRRRNSQQRGSALVETEALSSNSSLSPSSGPSRDRPEVDSEAVMEALRLATEARKCLERGAELLLAANHRPGSAPTSQGVPRPHATLTANACNCPVLHTAGATDFPSGATPPQTLELSDSCSQCYQGSQRFPALPYPVCQIQQQLPFPPNGVNQLLSPLPASSSNNAMAAAYGREIMPGDEDMSVPILVCPSAGVNDSGNLFTDRIVGAGRGELGRRPLSRRDAHENVVHSHPTGLLEERSLGISSADSWANGSVASTPAGRQSLTPHLAPTQPVGFPLLSTTTAARNDADDISGNFGVDSLTSQIDDDALGLLIMQILRSTPETSRFISTSDAGKICLEDDATPSTTSSNLVASFNDLLVQSPQNGHIHEPKYPTHAGSQHPSVASTDSAGQVCADLLGLTGLF